MKKNNSSGDAQRQNVSGDKKKDVNESDNKTKNNKKLSDFTSHSGEGAYAQTKYGNRKGTGMSSEAGSSQTDESWQGTGGSMTSEAQRKNIHANKSGETLKGSSNMSNTGNSHSMGGNADTQTLKKKNHTANNK